jgi:type I restriction enzyme S subunit
MDTQQFLKAFGHVANAPGGVAKLRELVFSLASEGKLLAHAESVLPTNLNEVADFVMGQAPPGHECNTKENGYVFVKTGEFGEVYPIVREWTTKPLKFAKHGDVLICVVGATVGKLNLAIDCAIGRSVAAIRPRSALASEYLYFMLMPFTLRLRSDSRGSAQGVIGKAELAAVKVRVPSHNEQALIVAKVKDLMALCDKLEAQQQARCKLQSSMRIPTLQAVASATSPQELQTTWARLAANFGQLFHAPENVRLLRDVIFDLALRGTLLPEASQAFPADGADHEAGPLPSGWQWRTLAELSEYITSGSRGWKSYMTNAGDSFIRSQDIRQDALIFENPAYVTLPKKAEGKRTLVQAGDLLLTITGGNVGKCAVVPTLPQDAYVSQHVALIRLRESWLSELVHFWMVNAFGGREFLSKYIYGDKPGLNLSQVGSVLVPVPPQSSCSTILQTLRHYQSQCDILEQQLRAKQAMAKQLAIAAVANFTGIKTTQAEEPMKAPQTELIAPLRLGQTPGIKAQAPLATILARHQGQMPAKDLWQRFGGEIDAFYAQLKTEVSHGWILEPAVAEMREVQASTAGV